MDKHLIFMDIDGTLVDRNQQISNKTKEVIAELQQEGHGFYVATGRKYSSALQIAQQLNPHTKVVASNGSVYSIKNQLYKKQLSRQALAAIYEAVHHKGLPLFFFGEHTIFYTEELPEYLKKNDQARVGAIREEDFQPIDSIDSLLSFSNRIINGIIIADGLENELQLIHEQLEVQDLLSLSSSHPNNIELIPKGVNKATAIQAIQQNLSIPKDRVISFGDGMNDLEMLQASGVSVAMGNAVEALKSQAKFVTTTNTEDGIANFLTNYFTSHQ